MAAATERSATRRTSISSAGTVKCNGSICTKTREWGVIVKPDALRWLAGENALSDDQFTTNSMHHRFCRKCGVHASAAALSIASAARFARVNVACLDNLHVAELAAAPVRYADGRNNNWRSPPAEVRRL